MAVPLIIGGFALAAGIFGAKKGLDAKDNYAEAKRVVESAENDFENLKNDLDVQKEDTSSRLRELGEVRLRAEGEQLRRFVAVVKPINQVTHKPITIGHTGAHIDEPEIAAMELSSYEAANLLTDGVAALSSGVLTGIGAGGLATSVGVASTGTAIASLSGVAATNATLAWLGGGALSAGGMGMAGGMAVLGGAIAGPAIAIMGVTAAKRSEKALTQAFERESEVRKAAEQVANGILVLQAIQIRAQELAEVILAVTSHFDGVLEKAEAMIKQKQSLLIQRTTAAEQAILEYSKKNIFIRLWHRLIRRKPNFSFSNPLDFVNFSDQEKSQYTILASFGYALNGLLRVKLLDDDGAVTHESEKVIEEVGKLLEDQK